ncbi:hypothetical protein BCR42DRAFT_200332 [Absidia repens]|uniref:Uncharacterized protein n=1 Tax=Absidia repens TaxID=90262 RepID=A0A1X2HRB2_9FUNG|nr:hypothetical protein BCR42DRAFT_200332 [Absidia repens]
MAQDKQNAPNDEAYGLHRDDFLKFIEREIKCSETTAKELYKHLSKLWKRKLETPVKENLDCTWHNLPNKNEVMSDIMEEMNNPKKDNEITAKIKQINFGESYGKKLLNDTLYKRWNNMRSAEKNRKAALKDDADHLQQDVCSLVSEITNLKIIAIIEETCLKLMSF